MYCINLLSHTTDMNIKITRTLFFTSPSLTLNSRDSDSNCACATLTTHWEKNLCSEVVPEYFCNYQAIYINIQASRWISSSWVMIDPLLSKTSCSLHIFLFILSLTPVRVERNLKSERLILGYGKRCWSSRVIALTLTDRRDVRSAECGWRRGGRWTTTPQFCLLVSWEDAAI